MISIIRQANEFSTKKDWNGLTRTSAIWTKILIDIKSTAVPKVIIADFIVGLVITETVTNQCTIITIWKANTMKICLILWQKNENKDIIKPLDLHGLPGSNFQILYRHTRCLKKHSHVTANLRDTYNNFIIQNFCFILLGIGS